MLLIVAATILIAVGILAMIFSLPGYPSEGKLWAFALGLAIFCLGMGIGLVFLIPYYR